MKALIFNGVGLEGKNGLSTAGHIVHFLQEELAKLPDLQVETFNVADSDIPMLDANFEWIPDQVQAMAKLFLEAEIHIWIAPMYHGSMPGAMKNCLDWLEITSSEPVPYLTNKIIGMVCWADGGQAMLGISSMGNVAKALRAWVLPYSIPIVRKDLFEGNGISALYQHKLEKMVHLLGEAKHFIHMAEAKADN